MCPPIADLPPAWLPVSQSREGRETFILLLESCGSGAEESDLCQLFRRLRWRFWSPLTLSFSNYSNFNKIFYLTGIAFMGWSGWAGAAVSPPSSVLMLCLFCSPFPEGFQSWMWRGLTFLLPFLFFGHVSWVTPPLAQCLLLHHTEVPWITRSHDKCFQGLVLFACN